MDKKYSAEGDDDVDVDFTGEVEDVQWVNVRVCCAADRRGC
jgi:hypothetical protein